MKIGGLLGKNYGSIISGYGLIISGYGLIISASYGSLICGGS